MQRFGRGLVGAALALLAGTLPAQAQERLSDGNILSQLGTGDSIEVALSSWVQGKATSPALKRYAATLRRDHSKGKKEVKSLATRLRIRPEPARGDTETVHAAHVDQRLRAIPAGFAFDTAASQHWVRDHKQDLKDTEKAVKEAHQAAVRRQAEQDLPVLRRHLREAEAVTAALERAHRAQAARR